MNDKTSKTNKTKTNKTKKKRLAKGLRKHIRQLKQEARKEGTVYRPPIIYRAPEKTAGE